MHPVDEVQKFMNKMSDPEELQGRIIFMSMFNDIIWRIKDNEQECIANATSVSVFAKDFQQDVCHSSDLDQKISGILLTTKDHEENGTESLTPANTLPVNTKPLQGARVSHLAGSSRAPRPRSITRAQDNTAVLDETLKLFVEATGKDEASMRQQLVNKRPAELQRGRNLWKTRVEEKRRFQAKKKEAWEFFRRMPSFKPKEQEEFEEEFKRRVMTGYSSGSTEGREKYLDEWMIELQKKALEGDSRLEAKERVKMGEEDAGSRRRTEWERIFHRSPFLKAAS